MKNDHGRLMALALLVTLAGCAPTPDSTEMADSVEPSIERVASASPSEPVASFPTVAFARISEGPVSEKAAASLQAALRETAGGGGMTATVMSPDGTWSGAAGKAHGFRDVEVSDQFAIGSVTKSVIAAQVMQMVEVGELTLDGPAADHLPPDLNFDTNQATIRELLGMRSGIPDYVDQLWRSLMTDRSRRWTPKGVLDLVAARRSPAGRAFEYSSTNYVLLGLIIEEVSGQRMVDVLRDGVLKVDGTERLIYQPDERPTDPIAMPDGESMAALKKGRGYLPSLAGVTAAGPAGGMASDSLSLARWWRAFCAGEIVSQDSLTEMTTFDDGDGYGLGLLNPASPYAMAVGHAGEHVGYVAWAGCLPEDGSVVVVLHNRMEDIGETALQLVEAVSSD
jgi:D-alanyl-D-alanine carboxypeptidase